MTTYPAAAGNRASSRAEKETHLRVRLIPFFGGMPLSSIDAADVARFVAELEAPPAPGTGARRALTPKSVRNIVQNLSKILTSAKEWGELAEVPKFPTLRRPSRPAAEFYRPEEVEALARAAEEEDDDPDAARAAILVAAKCGLRAGELLGLKWEAVNFATGELRIDRQIYQGTEGPTKTGGGRTVPMAKSVAEALRVLSFAYIAPGPTGLIFTDAAGAPRTISYLRGLLERVSKRAGVKCLHWHSLRHSMASNLVMAGVPLINVKEWLGHTSIATTMIYAHLAPKSNHHLISMLDTLSDERTP